MGHKVNPIAFRLGLITFWKTELFSHKQSTLFKEFFNIYRILKLALRVLGFELISFKFFKLKNLKNFILANIYKYCIFKRKLKKKTKKKSLSYRVEYSIIDARKRKAKKLNKKLKKIGNKLFVLKTARMNIEEYFDLILKNPIKLKLRSVFNFKKSEVFKISSDLYKKSLNNWKLKFFRFKKDTINIINFSFLFFKADLLSYFIARLLKFHKRIRFIANQIKNCMESFKFYQLMELSVRVSIFGKTRGIARTKAYSFSYGIDWPLQTISSKLSYDLAQTWNVYGAFGVKIWIFNHLYNKNLDVIRKL